ncbi:MAG: hypothetical protein ABFD89_00975 [Bryobacteraceae bacterium]
MKKAMWAVFDKADLDLRFPLHWDDAGRRLVGTFHDSIFVRGDVFFNRQFAAEAAKTWPGSRVVKVGLYRETPAGGGPVND